MRAGQQESKAAARFDSHTQREIHAENKVHANVSQAQGARVASGTRPSLPARRELPELRACLSFREGFEGLEGLQARGVNGSLLLAEERDRGALGKPMRLGLSGGCCARVPLQACSTPSVKPASGNGAPDSVVRSRVGLPCAGAPSRGQGRRQRRGRSSFRSDRG